jgi:hypothetical protein
MTAGCNMTRGLGAANAPAPALRLEKPRQSSEAGEQGHAYRERLGSKAKRCRPSRSGTAAPAWDGPQLQSAYAAQVIAQAMPAAERPSVRNAYGVTRLALPLLFDETL